MFFEHQEGDEKDQIGRGNGISIKENDYEKGKYSVGSCLDVGCECICDRFHISLSEPG